MTFLPLNEIKIWMAQLEAQTRQPLHRITHKWVQNLVKGNTVEWFKIRQTQIMNKQVWSLNLRKTRKLTCHPHRILEPSQSLGTLDIETWQATPVCLFRPGVHAPVPPSDCWVLTLPWIVLSSTFNMRTVQWSMSVWVIVKWYTVKTQSS
jgi:hypothetical protein